MARVIRQSVRRPPSLQRQVLFWLAALIVLALFLYVFSPILLPFVAGMAIAYALDPLADWLERRGLSRLWATLVILLLFAVIVAMLVITLLPALINQLVGLAGRLPDFVGWISERLQPLLQSRFAQQLGIDPDSLGSSLRPLASQAASWLSALLVGLWSGGQAMLSIISLFVVTPVVAFYLLYDWDRMVAHVDALLPRDHAPTIRRLGSDISQTIAAFVRGQGLLCIILGVFYAIALVAIGLNFGLLIGLMAGLLSFIPFVGSLVGFATSVIVAAVQFWPDQWIWIVVTAVVFVAGQFIEGNILQPRLVGNSVGLHPVWLMFALLAFAMLFGFVGTLIAVPVAAAIGVLVRFAVQRYRDSAFYAGRAGIDAETEPVEERAAGE